MMLDRAPTMETMSEKLMGTTPRPVEWRELSLPEQVTPPETRMLGIALLLSTLMLVVFAASLAALL